MSGENVSHYVIMIYTESSNNEHILWPTKILQHSFLLRFILKNNQLNALKLLLTKHIKTNIYIQQHYNVLVDS